MLLVLKRISFTKHGTFGVLTYTSPGGLIPICLTLEDPWLDNMPNISCIPSGLYICRRTESPKFGEVYEVTNVVGRVGVLFHKGNTMHDTQGCILLGATYENTNFMGIARSQEGYGHFWALVNPVNEFKLEIHNPN